MFVVLAAGEAAESGVADDGFPHAVSTGARAEGRKAGAVGCGCFGSSPFAVASLGGTGGLSSDLGAGAGAGADEGELFSSDFVAFASMVAAFGSAGCFVSIWVVASVSLSS